MADHDHETTDDGIGTEALTAGAVNDMINAALGKRVSRMVASAVKDALAEHVQPLTERFTALDEERAARAEQPDTPVEDPEKAEMARKLAAMQELMENMRAEQSAAKAELDGERAKAAQVAQDNMLGEHFRAAGVKPRLLKYAIQEGRDRLAVDDQGRTIWKGDDEFADPIDPAAGVAAWLATDEGKEFLPGLPVDRAPTNHPKPGSANGKSGLTGAELSAAIDGRP